MLDLARAVLCVNHVKTLGAYHLQHVMCHVVRKDSSTVTSDRVGIIYFCFILFAKTVKEGRKLKHSLKTPDNRL